MKRTPGREGGGGTEEMEVRVIMWDFIIIFYAGEKWLQPFSLEKFLWCHFARSPSLSFPCNSDIAPAQSAIPLWGILAGRTVGLSGAQSVLLYPVRRLMGVSCAGDLGLQAAR